MAKPQLPISLRSLLARRGCGCPTRYVAILSLINNLVLVFATASFQPVLAEQRSADADRHFSEGVRLLSKRDWKGASGKFREVLKLDPRRAEAYSELAMYHVQLGERERAINAVHISLL